MIQHNQIACMNCDKIMCLHFEKTMHLLIAAQIWCGLTFTQQKLTDFHHWKDFLIPLSVLTCF